MRILQHQHYLSVYRVKWLRFFFSPLLWWTPIEGQFGLTESSRLRNILLLFLIMPIIQSAILPEFVNWRKSTQNYIIRWHRRRHRFFFCFDQHRETMPNGKREDKQQKQKNYVNQNLNPTICIDWSFHARFFFVCFRRNKNPIMRTQLCEWFAFCINIC